MSAAPDRETVAVCIATFRRPQGLARALRGVDALRFEPGREPRLEVVVVDNDPDASARPLCERLAPELRWPLRYVHEPRRGLAAVRNRAVAEARAFAGLVAFLDDDEIPEPEWLAQLLAVRERFDADVVCGPVLRQFEEEPPEWVTRGGFFESAHHATGSEIPDPYTGNSLIRLAALEAMAEPFDERFGLTGGEDTHFFLRLGQAGRRMVWAEEARVHESVPVTRARAGWVLRRVYRTANTWSQCERELRPEPRVAAVRAAKGAARIAMGLALLPVSWLFGRHMVVKSLWYVCWGAGNITGLLGWKYHEYRVVHGG